MTDQTLHCRECGMATEPGEYHPYAACLMFKACGSATVVRANLDSVQNASAQDGVNAAQLVKSVQKDAQSLFDEYWLANYKSGCVISDPKWHAPRIFRAAVYAIDAALSAQRGEAG